MCSYTYTCTVDNSSKYAGICDQNAYLQTPLHTYKWDSLNSWCGCAMPSAIRTHWSYILHPNQKPLVHMLNIKSVYVVRSVVAFYYFHTKFIDDFSLVFISFTFLSFYFFYLPKVCFGCRIFLDNSDYYLFLGKSFACIKSEMEMRKTRYLTY